MLSAVLYFGTAAALLALARRFVMRFSLAAAAVLLLLPLTFTGRALLTGRLLAPVDIPYLTEPFYGMRAAHAVGEPYDGQLLDIACQMIPWRAALRETIAQGEWPLINRHVLAGDMLAGAAQPAAYSPFTWIALVAKPAESFNFTGAIAFFVAACGAFLFALDLGCGELAALFGAIAFAFSGPLAFAILWPLAFAWALLPLVLLAVRRRSFGLLTVALVLEILAGHPESVLHVGLLAGIWALTSRKHLLRLLAALALAIGLTAVYILPVIDAADQSAEHRFRQNVFAKSSRVAPAREIGAGVLTSLFPFLHEQKWLVPMRTPAFIGIGSLVLAGALAALVRVRTREVWILAALFVFCACAALQVAPVSPLLHALPFFNVVLNERLLFGASFCAAMLAAIGIDRASWRELAIVFVALAIGTFVLTRVDLTDHHVSKFRAFAVAGELIPLALAAFAITRRTPLPFLVALLLAQRVMEDGHWYPALPREAAYPRIDVLDRVKEGRVIGRGLVFMPNTSAVYGVDDVRGYEALTFAPLVETYPMWCEQIPVWFNRVDDLTRPMLSMMNVRYAMAKESDDVPDGWREIARQPGVIKLLENDHALPRAYVPRHVRLGTPRELLLPEMRGETDFGERSWIDSRDTPPREQENGPGVVNGEIVTMERDGWVVISQAAWRGWRAAVDGRSAHVARANHAFLAVHVPAGRHTLRLTFRPRSFVIGRTVTLISLLVTTVIVFVHRRRTIAAPA